MLTPDELQEVRDTLAYLLSLIGDEIDARAVETAYLQGATDALARVLDDVAVTPQ